MTRLNARQLRTISTDASRDASGSVTRRPCVLVLEDIYDTYNIGGLFRLADALACEKLYLCGETETPPNNRIHKASCGTYKVVPWEYATDASQAIATFRQSHQLMGTSDSASVSAQVIAVEQSPTSVPYYTYHTDSPLALVLGNETRGVSPHTLALCDAYIEIPMWGINRSLNVIVSAAIVAYHLTIRG